jgi:hypothetical protein
MKMNIVSARTPFVDHEKGMSGCLTWRFCLKLKNSEFSALMERDEWIQLARASRRKVARDHCDGQENKRCPG